MKQIQIVSIKMVKEKNLQYGDSQISSPYKSFDVLKKFLGDSDR